jgi:uncharacterized membrane protein YkvA (DUF1232 family)
MPIKRLKNDALTNDEKRQVKVFLDGIVKKRQGSFPLEDYLRLIEAIDGISNSKYDLLRELAIYLNAITKALNLKNDRHFFNQGEKILLGSLRYFVEIHDVIDDFIPDRGFLDDAYCVNYAISKTSKNNKAMIEHIAKHLKKKAGIS